MMKRRLLATGYGCLRVGILTLALSVSAANEPDKIIRVGDDRIPDQYIVVLNDSVLPAAVPETARIVAAAHGATPEKIWSHVIKGFFVRMSEETAQRLSTHPFVKYVEENAPWYVASSPQQTTVDQKTCDPDTNCPAVVDNRLWHLDRIDQNDAGPNNSFRYCADGSGVTVYLVDGGVNKYHQEFGLTQVKPGYNATSDQMPADDPCMGFAIPASTTYESIEKNRYHNEVYGSGHGTAVASMVGGKRVGVAKNVTIVPVKVIRCDFFSSRARISNHAYQLNETMFRPSSPTASGPLFRAITVTGPTGADPGGWPTSGTKQDGGVLWQVVPQTEYINSQPTHVMVDGLDWIIDAARNTDGPRSHAIVSISMGRTPTVTGWSGAGPSVEDSIQKLLANNMTVIASANNQNTNACDTSPARMSNGNPDPIRRKGVITVGGSMLLNRPWTVDVSDVPGGLPADPENRGTPELGDRYGPEPVYDATKPVRDARWICGPGDTSQFCNNAHAQDAAPPASLGANTFHTWQGGSNAGPCVTLFAPAKNIPVASVSAANGYRDPRLRDGHASGTSWSAPIVAGVAAQLLQSDPDHDLTPAEVEAQLLAQTVPTLDPDTLHANTYEGTPIPDTPNRMLRLGNVMITSGPTGTPSPAGTILGVTATGASLSYAWYRVNSNFDPTASRGAHYDPNPSFSSSTLVGTASTYTVQTPGRYWVRVTGACGAAESDIITATAPPPTSLVATATSVQDITLSWNPPSPPVTGATYRLRFRTAINEAWSTIPEVATTSYTHTGRTQGVMYEYEVVLKDPTGNVSPPITDYAVARPFTDDPITPGATLLKGVHIAELREATDAWRRFANLPATLAPYTPATGVVYASHWTQVLDATNAARAADVAEQPVGLTSTARERRSITQGPGSCSPVWSRRT